MIESKKTIQQPIEKTYNMLMNALKYSPSYKDFITLAHDIDDIDYDWLFHEIATKYPENYVEAYRIISQNQVSKKVKEVQEVQEVQEDQEVQEVQDYETTYKNDPTMQQVGADIESDDEHTTMTVRNGNEWTKVRVKRA
jgi:hypothetical protein